MSRSKSKQAESPWVLTKTIETAHVAGSFIELNEAEYTDLFGSHMTPEQDKMVKEQGLSVVVYDDVKNSPYYMLLQMDGIGRGKHYILGRLYRDGRAEQTIIEGLPLKQGSKIGLRLGPPIPSTRTEGLQLSQGLDVGLRLGPPIPTTPISSTKNDGKEDYYKRRIIIGIVKKRHERDIK
jgi:hypothetical protein